jgi:hypothetical protein
MQLLINGDRLIKEVQQEFAEAYPFLKIEFFKNNEEQKGHTLKQTRIEHNKKLGDAGLRKGADGNLIVEDLMSVTSLEKAFVEQFGLGIQVFRKSGNIWLETSITDGWTLKQQNELGKEISISKETDKKEDLDYDLNRDAI